jgi:hypothetical protein
VRDSTVELLHGSSGATVEVREHAVWKERAPVGVDRVTPQAEWLVRHTDRALPVVFAVEECGYLMERLRVVEPFTLVESDVDAIIGRLARGVWHRQAEVKRDIAAHQDKIIPLEDRYATHEMRSFLWDFRETAFDSDQRACLTHGDPTLDNVMLRNELFVITDPIPATPAIPDLWAVDLGKILQSLVGYESARYGTPQHNPLQVTPRTLLRTLEWNDQIRAVYWCVVHFLRAMPYVDDKIHDNLKRCAHDAISFIRS